MKHREVEAALEAAKVEVEQASAAIADGYAAQEERALAQARTTEEKAVAKVLELHHPVDGAAPPYPRPRPAFAVRGSVPL
jgi:hypothetical protein